MLDISGYTIIKQIGQGGMAVVYSAVQESVNRQVALKVLSPNILGDPVFCKRFLREARISGQLKHPQIVTIFDVSSDATNHYICMEYLAGGDLSTRLENKVVPTSAALMYAISIAQTLADAHQQGFVHRDIKPANIMFRGDNNPVITDFGIARAITSETRMTMAGAILGTPLYMSPEQTQGIELDGRADLYSLGILLFEMLTGECPFQADSPIAIGLKQVTEEVPQLHPPFDVFQPFFKRALAKLPKDRFSNGLAMAQALTKIQEKHPELDSMEAATFTRGKQVFARSASKNAFYRNGVLAIVLAIAGAFGWQQYQAFKFSNALTVQTETPVTPSGVAGGEDTLSLRLASLLAKSQQQQREGFLVSPENNNAFTTYQTLLSMDANHQPAKGGIEAIASTLSQAMNRALETENMPEAESRLAELFRVNETLALEAEQQVLVKQQQIKQQQTIATALAKAASLLGGTSVALPQLSSAIESLQTVLAFDENHIAALQQWDNVVNTSVQLIQSQQAETVTETSIEVARKSIEFLSAIVADDNFQLISRQNKQLQIVSDFEEKIKTEQLRLQKFNSTVQGIEGRLEKENPSLTELQTIRNNIASIAQYDASKATGFLSILRARYDSLVEAFLENDDLPQAQAYVDQGLRQFPESNSLAKLQDEVVAAQKRRNFSLPAF